MALAGSVINDGYNAHAEGRGGSAPCYAVQTHVQGDAEDISHGQAEQQRAAAIEEHGENGVTGAHKEAHQGTHERHQQIVDAAYAQIPHAKIHHLHIRAEQPHQLFREQLYQREYHHVYGHGKDKAPVHGGHGTFRFVRAEVLGAHGGYGAAKGNGRQYGEKRYLVSACQSGRSGNAHGVDHDGQQQERQSVDRVLDGGGDAGFEQYGEFFPVYPNIAEAEIENEFCLSQMQDAKQHAYALSDNGGKSRAESAPFEDRDEKQVEHDVYAAGDADEDKGTIAVAHTAKDGAQRVVAEDEYETNGADIEINKSFVHGFGGRFHHVEYAFGKYQRQNSGCQRQNDDERHQRTDDLLKLFVVPAAPVLTDDNGAAKTEANGYVGYKGYVLGADVGACQRDGTGKLTENDKVNRAVQVLNDAGQNKGQCKKQQLPGYTAFRKVFSVRQGGDLLYFWISRRYNKYAKRINN